MTSFLLSPPSIRPLHSGLSGDFAHPSDTPIDS
ncbi:hypothetical protein J2T49_001231 [Pseudomonas nitroreducens]|nr:hypothetical protein [Pseudomonas nitroreducens]MCP1685292.1 hypothetical protein [Pseudomonas nitroreducens]